MPNNPISRRADRPRPPPTSANKIVRGASLPAAAQDSTTAAATSATSATATSPADSGGNAVSNSQLAQMPANTVKANATNAAAAPTDVAMAASTILARLASGNMVAATVAQILTLLGLSGGITAVISTAKLTAGGTDGSMTFTNGILTAHTDAT